MHIGKQQTVCGYAQALADCSCLLCLTSRAICCSSDLMHLDLEQLSCDSRDRKEQTEDNQSLHNSTDLMIATASACIHDIRAMLNLSKGLNFCQLFEPLDWA